MWILGVVVICVAAGMAYIRLAPSDPARWHVVPEVTGDADLEGGVTRLISGDEATLARLHAIITDTPRTQVLAGDPATGMITYVTRSKVFGFPDYATVRLRDGAIAIRSRLRFGRSDLGVNKARVDGWLETLRQGG